MKISINDLPELLTDLIKKSGKTKQEIQRDVNLSNSTLSRLCNRRHGMQKSTAKVLNDYFEVPYFTSYQIKNGVCVHSDVIVPNYKGNKYNPGDTVMNLFNRNIFMVTEIKFNKATQEWMYKHNNEWVEEYYIKGITLEEPKPIDIPNGNNIKPVYTPNLKDMEELNTLDDILDEVLLGKKPDTPKPEVIDTQEESMADDFVIPQIEITPEENIQSSIEKIDNKDSIKSILKDVVIRLINLL